MSDLRFLFRYVHCKLHELSDRGSWYGTSGNGTIPAVYSERIRLAKHAGMQVMEMYRKNIRPRDIMTKEAILNALTVDMALGCSTNSMLHLPAIAHEIGMILISALQMRSVKRHRTSAILHRQVRLIWKI